MSDKIPEVPYEIIIDSVKSDIDLIAKRAYNRGKEDGKKEERERIIALFAKPMNDPNAFSVKELWTLARITKNIEKQKKADEFVYGDEVEHGGSRGIVYAVGDQILEGLRTDDGPFVPFQWYKPECKKTGRRFQVCVEPLTEEVTE